MAKDGFCVKPGIETASGVKAQRIEKRAGPNILSFQIFLSLFLEYISRDYATFIAAFFAYFSNIKKQRHYLYCDFAIFLKEEQSQSVILCCLVSEFLKRPQPNTVTVSDDDGDGRKTAR